MPMSPRLLRPRASGFNPKSITGLKLWLDIANKSSLTFNGNTVSQVNDLSGNGFHATQGTANNQPTYSATGLNSKPALSFDSTDSLLSTATVSDVVANPTTSPAVAFAFVCLSPAAAAGFSAGSDNTANGRLGFQLPFDTAGNSYFDVAGFTGGRLGAFTLTSAQQSVASVYVLQRNGADMVARRNGVVLASKSNASQVFSATSAKIQIGQAFGLTGFQSTVAEFLIYAAGLTATQISAVERGLGKKWGITVT